MCWDVCVQTKEHVFQSKACAEFAKLRTVQAELEQEAGQSCFLGCSVIETGWMPGYIAVTNAAVTFLIFCASMTACIAWQMLGTCFYLHI